MVMARPCRLFMISFESRGDWYGMRVSGVVLTAILWSACVGLGGCGGPSPVRGGTTGVVRAGELLLAEIEVTVYRLHEGDWELVGTGITNHQGEFALLQPQARGALWLPPGEYRATIASHGADPVRFPKEFRAPEDTPLIFTWSADQQQLTLDVPTPVAGL